MKMMSDDLFQRNTTLHHHRAFVPGFKNLTAIDTLYKQAFENHLIPVNASAIRHDRQHRYTAAINHQTEHIFKCLR